MARWLSLAVRPEVKLPLQVAWGAWGPVFILPWGAPGLLQRGRRQIANDKTKARITLYSGSASKPSPMEDIMKAHRPTIMGTRHMVVACQYLAAEAGFRILEAGGNAIDAGVAAGIALGVVQPEYVNFGGVAPIMIYSAAEDRVFTIPGLGTWPKTIERDHFKKHHAGKIPQGVLRTVVPAAPDAWISALGRFGTMSFGDVAQSAIGFARDGFPVCPLMSEIITEHEAEYRMFPSNVALYLPQGRPPLPRRNLRAAGSRNHPSIHG
jgi:gamma-glutamyltranspeptidase